MNGKKIYYSILTLVFVILFFWIIDHYHRTVAENNEIRMNIKKLEDKAKPPPRPLILPPDPTQGIPMPPPPQKGKIEIDKDLPPVASNPIEIEMIGLLKLKINDNILWETIAKILVLLLCSYGGVKYINKRFA